MENKKSHWENVFATKNPNEVSWTQKYPKTSMEYLENVNPVSYTHLDVYKRQNQKK